MTVEAQAVMRTGSSASGAVQHCSHSNEQRLVLSQCVATIGVLSNPQHKNTKLGKAGAARWLGRRPRVRGVAMNPVDHPHGAQACPTKQTHASV